MTTLYAAIAIVCLGLAGWCYLRAPGCRTWEG